MKKKLELESRRRIYQEISSSPGVHFRELERALNEGIGNLQYHLRNLQERGLVECERSGNRTCYYPAGEFSEEQRSIMKLLRHTYTRRVLVAVLAFDEPSHSKIARELGIPPSTVTLHLKKLREAKLIEVRREGRVKRYSVVGPEEVVSLYIAYKEGLLDSMVDNMLRFWEGI